MVTYLALFCCALPGVTGIRRWLWLLSQGVGCLSLPWPQAEGPRVRGWLPAREGGSEEEEEEEEEEKEAGRGHCPLT